MTTVLPTPPARGFASDNAAGAHPRVLAAVTAANEGHALAYGADAHTAECERRFDELFDRPVVTRLTFNGTGANIVSLAAALGTLPGPHHAVVCSSWAHIHVDETGAPERALGTKLLTVPSDDAKIRPDDLDEFAHLQGVQHHAQPGVLSITQATELGTVYRADEIGALCDKAHSMGMLVHLDGARIANATAALGADTATLREFTADTGVDIVSFGGTKVGGLGAEAVVFLDPGAGIGSDYVRKQVTQLPSKMRFLAAQFNALLTDDLWIDLAAHANEMARELHAGIASLDVPGLDPGPAPAVNSLFPRLPRQAIGELRDWSFFWDWDVSVDQVRWMTSWDTTIDDITTFVEGVGAVLRR